MTHIKRALLLILAAVLILGLSACGGKKTVDITEVILSEDSHMLMVTYVAKGNIAAGEGAFKITISGDIGSVYGMSELDNDLEKNTQHILMYTLKPAIGQIEWKVGETLNLNGTKVMSSVTTDDILKLFGDFAVISVEFQVDGKTVAEKALGE